MVYPAHLDKMSAIAGELGFTPASSSADPLQVRAVKPLTP
jgi:hypothetical protein